MQFVKENERVNIYIPANSLNSAAACQGRRSLLLAKIWSSRDPEKVDYWRTARHEAGGRRQEAGRRGKRRKYKGRVLGKVIQKFLNETKPFTIARHRIASSRAW